MNDDEQILAKSIYQAIMEHSRKSPRSIQAESHRFGISDIGYCQERSRRMLDRQVPEDTDLLAAAIGTAIGDYAEDAIVAHLWPHAIKQATVTLRVAGTVKAMYELEGHPDLIVPDWGIWDGKTDYGLATVEREGPSFQQRFQRHGYALAAWEAGFFGDMPLDEVQVGNFWIDRGAQDKYAVVNTEKFDADVIAEGVEWLDSVVYAYLNNEEAMKEPPRQVCEVTCGFFKICREYDTDVHGLIDDPFLLGHIEAYVKGQELTKEGNRLKDQAKAHLDGISGSTGRHTLRWTWVNPSEIKGYTRKGYYKITLGELK